MIRLPLKKLSCCPCGYATLHDDIPLGTRYLVDPTKIEVCDYRCGKCGREFKLRGIWTFPRKPGQSPGFLPETLFTDEPLPDAERSISA